MSVDENKNKTLDDIFRDLIEPYRGLNKTPMSFNGHLGVDSIGIKMKQNEMCIHIFNLKKELLYYSEGRCPLTNDRRRGTGTNHNRSPK